MRTFISIKYHSDHRNREQIEQISTILHQSGFETVCIARDFEKWGQVRLDPHNLMQLAFEQIDHCDILIVDLTEKGVGIGIEAGYAAARNIPIVAIAFLSCDISESLQGISSQIHFYETFDDLRPVFENLSSIL